MISKTSRKLVLPVITAGLILGSSIGHSASIALDGDLTDLIAHVNAAPDYSGSVTESGVDAEGNGFDITNAYFTYDILSDTFYMGFQTFGAFGTAGGNEGVGFPSCNIGQPGGNSGSAGLFDGCENVGFSIDLNNDSTIEFQFNVLGDAIANSGLNTEQTPSLGVDNTPGAVVNWIASEANDGVEFSVTGLGPLSFSVANPLDISVVFNAGTGNNFGPEDFATINTQLVPVPAAVWLFGSGLLGLLGVARRGSRRTA
ncbi:hypothetical protein MNBD_GAMMA15-1674 [hydrothermal vent metagenome]|uniref:PEP-CTERM protein-sorting domain-containing protein n=1 Tax=hydrothermal vent metagenome TaxID=652676 RepID=A0A3B0YUR7_9ZZZZ